MIYLIIILIGAIAQLIDGSLGMGFGVTSTSALLTLGLYPQVASAAVHMAEIFTSLVSGASHYKLGNVKKEIALPLTITGVIGGVLGASLAVIIPVLFLKTSVSFILLILGAIIVLRFFKNHLKKSIDNEKHLSYKNTILLYEDKQKISSKKLSLIGGVAGFLDAIGGGGWGPIATSNLVLDENIKPNEAIGSVNFAEFFQTIFVSITFFILLPELEWSIILSLILGGIVIAPFAALFAKKIPHKQLGIAIGVTVILLSINNLTHIFLSP